MHIFYKVRSKFKSSTVLFFSLSEDVLWRSFHLMVTLYPLVQLYHMYLTYGSSQRIWTPGPLPHSSFFRICLSFSLVCLFFLPMGVFPIVHAVYPPHTPHSKIFYYPASFSSGAAAYLIWGQSSSTRTQIIFTMSLFYFSSILWSLGFWHSPSTCLTRLLPLCHPLKTFCLKPWLIPKCRSLDGCSTP